MKAETETKKARGTSLIKKCHTCGHLNETTIEPMKCNSCHQNFLPLQYFAKIHSKSSEDYVKLFCKVEEIHEEDIIKGLYVIW